MNWLKQLFSFVKFAYTDETLRFKEINTLQQILRPLLVKNPQQEDPSKRNTLIKIQNSPAVQQILNTNYGTISKASNIDECLRLLSMYFPTQNMQMTAAIRSMSKALIDGIDQRKQEQDQLLANKHIKKLKVETFKIQEETSDHTNYYLMWTPHTEGFPIFKTDGNIVKDQLENKLHIKLAPDRQTRTWIAVGLTPEKIQQMKQIFAELGYDTTLIDQLPSNTTIKSTKFPVAFTNVSQNTTYHLSVDLNKTFLNRPEKQEVFLNQVEIAFPLSGGKPNDIQQQEEQKRRIKTISEKREEIIQPAGYSYVDKNTVYIRGNYNNYQYFQMLLNLKGFDADNGANSLYSLALMRGAELRNSGHVKISKIINGVLDGYYITDSSGKKKFDNRTGLYSSNTEVFKQEVLNYDIQKPNQQPFKLYNPQIDSVQWLYSRQSALLGSSPGTGKTETTIIAADMRTKPQNLWDNNLATGKVLIFTLASVVPQFADRIKSVKPNDLVATNLQEMTPDTKWLVLSYGTINALTPKEQQKLEQNDVDDNQDSDEITDPDIANLEPTARQNKVQQNIATLKSIGFDVLILDECHKVKNSTSATSANIIEIGKSIPFKWGASATISANKPIDIYQQLHAVGNSLGYMDKNEFRNKFTRVRNPEKNQKRAIDVDPTDAKKFINEFVRKTVEGYDSLPTIEKQKAAIAVAENTPFDELQDMTLRQVVNAQIKKTTDLAAMLILTDVYQRKTKKEINPNIPEHTRMIGFSQDPNQPDFIENFNKRDLLQLKDQVLKQMTSKNNKAIQATTKILAYRKAMALTKVPHSVSHALNLIELGQKVLIFTCFYDSARALQSELNAKIEQNGLIAFMSMGDETDKSAKIAEFMNPKSNVRAYVLGIESSGTGLDFPNICENVIVNDITWTPKDADQVEGRAFRVNSKSPVTTHYMVLKDTPDETIYITVQKKRDIARHIQEIDEEYAQNIRNNKSIKDQLQQAQDEHWQLVKEQLIAEISVQDWTQNLEQQKLVAANWLLKLFKKCA